MPCINFANEQAGPTLEIGLTIAQTTLPAGAQRPAITWIKAIADTGCSHTSIYSGVAQSAGLPVIGKQLVTSTTGQMPVDTYFGDLWLRFLLPNGQYFEWVFADRQFPEMLHSSTAFEALLGMDILSLGMLVVHGKSKTTTFCW